MSYKKIQFTICILTILLISVLFYSTIQESELKLERNLYNVSSLFTPTHYSFDGMEFMDYSDDIDFLNLSYDELYVYGQVQFTGHTNKLILIKSVNAIINLYDSNGFFRNGIPVTKTNNTLVTTDYDMTFLNLGDYKGQFVMFHILKDKLTHNMFLHSYNAISQDNLYDYIVNFLQTHFVFIGIALGCIFLVFTVMFYRIYKPYYFGILTILLTYVVILYVSNTSYLKYSLYPSEYFWFYLSQIIVLMLNTVVYSYICFLERLEIRKLSKSFIYGSMAATVVILRSISSTSLNADTLQKDVAIGLIIFIIFNFILFVKIFVSNIKYIKERTVFKNVLSMKKIFLCCILFFMSFVNLYMMANNLNLITNNQLFKYSSASFLFLYSVTIIIVSTHLGILKFNFNETPKLLANSRSIVNNLNKHQNLLYSKDSTEDFILTVFKSAEELCGCKLSGYYLITDKNHIKKVIQGYGKFENLKNVDYFKVNIKQKYNAKKGWHIFSETKRYEQFKAELCVLPDKTLKPNDVLLLNTFFNIAYDVIFNFILLQNMFDDEKQLVYSLTEISEIRSKETGSHIKRVSKYCEIIGRKYGLDDENVDLLVTASKMHDLGKLNIPDEILHKPGKLTNDEFSIMKTHALAGYSILYNCTGKYLEASKLIAKNHHEKFNGKGYYGISGYEIDLFSRIVAIADVFDALAFKRCYKEAWKIELIVEFFKKERGEHFDPDLVDIFLDSVDEFVEVQNEYK